MKRVKYIGGGVIAEVGRHRVGDDKTFICEDKEAESLVAEQPSNFEIVGSTARKTVDDVNGKD